MTTRTTSPSLMLQSPASCGRDVEKIGGTQLVVRRAARHRAGVELVERPSGDQQERILAGDRFQASGGTRRAEARRAGRARTRRGAGSACRDDPRRGTATAGRLRRAARTSSRARLRRARAPRSRSPRASANSNPLAAHRPRDLAEDLPVRLRAPDGPQRRADALDAALGVHERAVLLERRARRQEHRAELARGLGEEQVLDDHQIERPQARERSRSDSGLVSSTS